MTPTIDADLADLGGNCPPYQPMTRQQEIPAGNMAASPDPPATRFGYLVLEFPSHTHAFFWREICALRELGAQVRLQSCSRPRPGAARHAFAEAAAAEAECLCPADPGPNWFLLLRPLRLMWAGRLSRLVEQASHVKIP
jgi:hypothetical protein